jgi:DNA-binding CsgD family transcriptional regulator
MSDSSRLALSLSALRAAPRRGGLDAALDSISTIYGVKHATCLVVRGSAGLVRFPCFATSYPRDWTDLYLQRSYFDIDPVIDVIRWSRGAVDWSGFDTRAAAVRRFFDDARRHAVGAHGLTIPVRGPSGERSLFSISSDQRPQDWAATRDGYAFDFHILSHYLHEAVMTDTPAAIFAPAPPLSRRERQCLEGLATGLLPKQIAAALDISESAVRLYQRSARRKLGAATTYQAIARASFFELISF